MADTGGVALDVISDLSETPESQHFLYVMNERTSLHRERVHLKVPGWSLI